MKAKREREPCSQSRSPCYESYDVKVLIVDDEVIVAKALMRAFQGRGHEVSIVHSGEAGLEQWLKEQPDVIFLDVVMPGLTGPQVIEEFRRQNNVKGHRHFVILMTAHSDVKHKASAQQIGADDFLQKPFEDVFALVKKVEKQLEGKK